MEMANATLQTKGRNDKTLSTKLFLILLAMAGTAIVLVVVVSNALLGSNRKLDSVMQKVLPVISLVEKFTAANVQLNAEVPDVLTAKDQVELSAKYTNLIKFIDKQVAFLKDQNATASNTELTGELLDLIEKATEKLVLTNDYMSNILWTKNLENKFSLQVKETGNKFMLHIEKLADDALFSLINNVKSKENTKSTPAIKEKNATTTTTDSSLANQLNVYNALLQIKVDGVLIIGFFETVINHMNAEEIVPYKERFESAASQLNEHLQVLIDDDGAKFKDLLQATKDLVNLGQEKDNCFSLRETELRFTGKIADVSKELKPMGNRIDELEKLLLLDILKNIDKLTGFQGQYNKLVFILAWAGLFFVAVIASCLYIVRRGFKSFAVKDSLTIR